MSAAALRAKVSESSIRRLSGYHRILEELEREGIEMVSSARLASLARTNPAQIRKDLSYFGTFGKRGSGYAVKELRRRILDILGLNRPWRVALAGAGNLGHALFSHKEFARYGFDIVAVFDNDPAKIGQTWDGIRISSLEESREVVAATRAELAVVATPASAAPAVVEKLARAGVRGFLNFASRKMEVPESIELRSVNITVELEGLTFALRQRGR